MTGFFVTGTDTGVGKTALSIALMRLCMQRGQRVAGFKPVASGAIMTRAGLRNEDALELQKNSNIAVQYAAINPYCFAPAMAPHLAAQSVGEKIALDKLVAAYTNLEKKADIVIVEGAGGWRVPLHDDADIAMLAQRLGLPVVLVVAIRLGCLNHALLSVRDIIACGLPLAGWVANLVDVADKVAMANVDSLKKRIAAPCWGVVPRLENFSQVNAYLSPSAMLNAL
ncbi:MAG: dethiobiotin synthase [Pseudomonadota bacterium]